MNKYTLNIGGMHCAACAARVEKAVKNIEGVKSASVNLASEKLYVECDDTVTLALIKETVIDAGYEVLEPKNDSSASSSLSSMEENWEQTYKIYGSLAELGK